MTLIWLQLQLLQAKMLQTRQRQSLPQDQHLTQA